jgi:hypothetical protein
VKDQRLPTVDEWISLHGDERDITESPHLITVDELRAAGALDVPAAWRKSLGGEERRHLLPGFDDGDAHAESQAAAQNNSERDEPADELA